MKKQTADRKRQGALIVDTKDFARSLNHAQKAVALSSRKDPGYLDTLAWALLRTGKLGDAVRAEEEAIAILEDRQTTEADLRDYRRALQVFKAAR